MPRPQTIETAQFHAAFVQILNTRSPVGYDLTQKQACEVFEDFNRAERHNFWLELSVIITKKQNQCLLHYRHCYSKAKYTESLQPYKTAVEQMVADLIQENYEPNDIIKAVKDFLYDKDIFPSAIESFVYQCVSRVKSNRRLRTNDFKDTDLTPLNSQTDKNAIQTQQQIEEKLLSQIQKLLM
ncbi:hypothetical protein SS50377_20114 [Spironucleus salmonicida]|uniref:Uncharacterized protein n=1 Tax=Spironucleus salmonicida TaxID=348837 RepID=V6LKM5_9EUKA|nr:hypothetical protein SS50377_20114 [Spironucleus salmonicida]|eukprot:EST45170.1 Hypothetical protein SS50377_14743 [Spironucleus salmonicida]